MNLWKSLIRLGVALGLGFGTQVAPAKGALAEDVVAYQAAAAAMRQRMADDPDLPLYHYMPPGGRLGDPNGLIQYRGQYHLFFQYNPAHPAPGAAHWGHAVSSNLVHWRDLPIALTPTPGGYDKDGCYSGCAVLHNGVPTLVYTGIGPQVQCLATAGDDDLVTWKKYEGNPVLHRRGVPFSTLGWRDPYAWREEDGWRMTISSGIPDAGGAVLLYKAPDLVGPWQYDGLLFIERFWLKDPPMYENFECVNFLPIGDQWLLLISYENRQRAYWILGDYRDGVFTPRESGPIDGNMYKHPVGFYAPQAFRDENGRVLLVGWLKDFRETRERLYEGAVSLPRELTVHGGKLRMTPVPELQALRGEGWNFENLELTEAGLAETLSEARGECLELEARIRPGAARQIVLKVRGTPDSGNDKPLQTRIVINRDLQELVIDRRWASAGSGIQPNNVGTRLDVGQHELHLRVFVDRSVIEVFVNDSVCLTARVYPGTPEADRIDVLALGGMATLESLRVWKMKPIWPEKAN